MSAEDTLRRLEQRAKASQYTRWVIVTLVVLAALIGAAAVIHRDGIQEGRALEQQAKVQNALHVNADSLRRVHVHGDSLRIRDSVASAIAAADRRAAAVHRAAVDRAARAVTVSGQVGDSLVVVERPAAGANDSARVDSLTTLPLPIATFIREAKLQLALDTLALHGDSVAMEAKDGEIINLRVEVKLLNERDLLHTDYEQQLRREGDAKARRRFWGGVKTGVVGTVVVLGTLVIVF